MAAAVLPAEAATAGNRGMLDGLQALRGIAAVMVVIDHAILAVIPYDPMFAPLLDFAGTIGKMGVNLFFVISGFIMMYTTEPIKARQPAERVANFAWKRATRLVPLYWLATLLMIASTAMVGFHYTAEHILTSFTFLPNFEDAGDPRMPPIVGVGWTITYEMFFYSLFALCLLLPRRIGPLACIGAIVAMVGLGTVLVSHIHDPELRRIVAFYSYKNMLFFSVGIAIALGLDRIPRIAGPVALGGALVLMVAALTMYWELRMQNGSLLWQGISFMTCTCVGILVAGNRHREDIPARRLLLHIGDASFSTYLFHAPLLHALAGLSVPLLVRGHGGLFVVVAGMICLAAGSLIHARVELPLTRLIRGLDLPRGGARRALPSIGSVRDAVRWPTLEGRRVELDFLRGVAIILACGSHFNQTRTGIAPLDWLLAPGRLMGWAGVDLFFVLSGFLIGGLLFSEFANEGSFRPGRFLIRRAFKIWPVLYAFLVLQLILRQHPWQSFFFQCLFHVQNYFPTPLSPLWSLAVEEQFYLVFAVLYTLVLAYAGSIRPMPWLLGGLMVVVLVARSIAVGAHVNGDAMMQTQFRIDALACGVALRYVHLFHRELFDRIASWKVPLALFWLGGACMISSVYVNGDFMHSIGLTLVYLSAACFLLFCYDMPAPVARSALVRGLAYVGLFSYAIYVCQYAAVRPAAALAERLQLTGSAAAVFRVVLSYAGAFVAGFIVTLLVERPMLMVRRRLFYEGDLRARQKDLFTGAAQSEPALADGQGRLVLDGLHRNVG